MGEIEEVAGAWQVMMSRVAPDASAADVGALGARLLGRWGEEHRHYHDTAHLVAVLKTIDEYADAAEDADAVRLAAWYHDAVYDPRADDNEAASAALARTELTGLGVPAATVAEVVRLVELTTGHAVEPGDRNGALLADADLAILASPPTAYEAYAAAVRREYAHVPDDAFRAGRAAVLRRLLRLPRLFHTPELAARAEAAARANLEEELIWLNRNVMN
ncbi:metal-dependent phosphohydrolase [Luedemannella helvata]|uniref:Metal-dependent phosphohydrolase n=1 Tax=Luedemannella helvata TaxID=349315 RepID=A0ABN2KFH0_9ACTN